MLARPPRLALIAFAVALALPALAQDRPAREAPGRDAKTARPASPAVPVPLEASATLKRIHDSGLLRLGVREASVPFSFLDAKGEPEGYTIDLCLKVADALKVQDGKHACAPFKSVMPTEAPK